MDHYLDWYQAKEDHAREVANDEPVTALSRLEGWYRWLTGIELIKAEYDFQAALEHKQLTLPL